MAPKDEHKNELYSGKLNIGGNKSANVPFYLLLDSAYANTKYTVTTYELSEIEKSESISWLNRKLASMRYIIECAFGILKSRFRILSQSMKMAQKQLELVPTIIGSLCVLHNF